jgi:ubiquinone/menaquinone biosynthesis C-methylase UbiE
MEQEHVHDVYSSIAAHFNETRYKPWFSVRSFLQSVPSGSQILEVGCGNGKNLGERPDCIMFGCDPCKSLLEFAQLQHPTANLCIANGLALPYPTASMDIVMSIAVFHHLTTIQDRRKFLQELARVYTGRGGGMITVMSPELVEKFWTPLGPKGDYFVPWTNKQDGVVYQRYYHVFDKEELEGIFEGILPIREITSECGNWYVYI